MQIRQWFLVCILCLAVPVRAKTAPDQARLEVGRLSAKVKLFRAVPLRRAAGEVVLKPAQSLTVDRLRNARFDDNEPAFRQPDAPYDPHMGDGFAPGKAPYVARGIRPFRFRYFRNEFNYGGWHNWNMIDYAASHGFSILYPYNFDPASRKHLPAGTRWLCWSWWVDWPKWMPAHGMEAGRWDQLMDRDIAAQLFAENIFQTYRPGTHPVCMVDQEYGYLPPEQLRQRSWYPSGASSEEKAAFECKYYLGYARSLIAIAETAHRQEWKEVGIYDGYSPFPRMWWGLEKADPNPDDDWAWNLFGKQVYDAYDILYTDVYCFYPSPQNVAYTLANIDLNRRMIRKAKAQKPIRPYYWTLLHGGDASYHWWANQPLTDEETRAMTAFCFFAGTDGLVLWNWSETGSHHAPPPLTRPEQGKEVGNDVMVGKGFFLKSDDEGSADFRRYEMLHIVDADKTTGNVRFQRIETPWQTGAKDIRAFRDYAYDPDKPVYTMPEKQLNAYLRPASDPVSAMVEGLALVKPFEYLLRHGKVMVDVPAQKQFAETLPIVRRVRLGRYHLLATYDPACAFGKPGRMIALQDFDGKRGLTLKLPADQETRLFLLEER
ncbi:MAG: hypothetical protein IT210_23240 [Armatimonadetes bacterium]|nr:hypothetical protein [Armatimonadota bacterium]